MAMIAEALPRFPPRAGHWTEPFGASPGWRRTRHDRGCATRINPRHSAFLTQEAREGATERRAAHIAARLVSGRGARLLDAGHYRPPLLPRNHSVCEVAGS